MTKADKQLRNFHAIHDADDPARLRDCAGGRATRSRAGRRDDALQRGAEGCRRADHAGRPAPAVNGRARLVCDGEPIVTDGPFAEAKEVLGGYWMIDVASRAEAIAWAKKCPGSPNEIVEIRQVQEMADFSPEVQEAAAGFSELLKGSQGAARG